jgi:hypothetical protein
LSLKRKVEEEIRHEKQLERNRKTQIWQEQKIRKDALLKQLGTFEKMAQNLDGAEALRRLATKLGESSQPSPELTAKLKLLTDMADWLDPVADRSNSAFARAVIKFATKPQFRTCEVHDRDSPHRLKSIKQINDHAGIEV